MDGLWWSIVVRGVVVAICGNEKKMGNSMNKKFWSLDTTTNPIPTYS
jgi:hypothetical protein